MVRIGGPPGERMGLVSLHPPIACREAGGKWVLFMRLIRRVSDWKSKGERAHKIADR